MTSKAGPVPRHAEKATSIFSSGSPELECRNDLFVSLASLLTVAHSLHEASTTHTTLRKWRGALKGEEAISSCAYLSILLAWHITEKHVCRHQSFGELRLCSHGTKLSSPVRKYSSFIDMRLLPSLVPVPLQYSMTASRSTSATSLMTTLNRLYSSSDESYLEFGLITTLSGVTAVVNVCASSVMSACARFVAGQLT
jgi:hypothetical protein